MMGLFDSVLEAQPPPQSDVQPEDTREAWERTDYGSGPDRRLDMSPSCPFGEQKPGLL